MISRKFKFIEPTRSYRELAILSEVQRNPRTSQRMIARQALVSSTVVNEYLNDMIGHGFIVVNGDSKHHHQYNITGNGLQRKNELFFLCSREVIQFYAEMRQEFRSRLEAHHRNGIDRVVLFGAAETGELVLAVSAEAGITVIGIVDNDEAKIGRTIGKIRVSHPSVIRELKPDAVIVTSFGHMDEIFEQNRDLEKEGIKVCRL